MSANPPNPYNRKLTMADARQYAASLAIRCPMCRDMLFGKLAIVSKGPGDREDVAGARVDFRCERKGCNGYGELYLVEAGLPESREPPATLEEYEKGEAAEPDAG